MDRRVEDWNADSALMLCPVCGFENLKGGDEVCSNCGAELSGHDTPQPALSFHGRLLGEHLDDLGAPEPLTVGPDAPVDAVIARMQATETDCVLVTLWDVNSASVSVLFESLYKRLREYPAEGVARSLQAVRRELRETAFDLYSAPHHWAPVVCYGIG